MKSIVLRLFPAWIVILVLKVLFGIEYSVFSLAETVIVAFVWASIHEMLGNKTSYRVLCATTAVFIVGAVLTFMYTQCPLLIRIGMIAIGGYMVKTAWDKIGEINLRNSDNNRYLANTVRNVFGIKLLNRYIEAMEEVTEKGAKALGVEAKFGYQGYSPLFKETFYKIWDKYYHFYRLSPDKTIIYGRDGLAILRTIDEAGDYEFKDGKWYKDGKKCTNFNKEASRLLDKLSGERGTNRVILVKTFEGGSVNGAGCGMYITDITRGDKKLIEAIEKITRTEGIKSKASKKASRITRALLALR